MFNFRRKQENQNAEETINQNTGTNVSQDNAANAGQNQQPGVFGSFNATGGNFTSFVSQQAASPPHSEQQVSGQTVSGGFAGAQPNSNESSSMGGFSQTAAPNIANQQGGFAAGQTSGAQAASQPNIGEPNTTGGFGMSQNMGQQANSFGVPNMGQQTSGFGVPNMGQTNGANSAFQSHTSEPSQSFAAVQPNTAEQQQNSVFGSQTMNSAAAFSEEVSFANAEQQGDLGAFQNLGQQSGMVQPDMSMPNNASGFNTNMEQATQPSANGLNFNAASDVSNANNMNMESSFQEQPQFSNSQNVNINYGGMGAQQNMGAQNQGGGFPIAEAQQNAVHQNASQANVGQSQSNNPMDAQQNAGQSFQPASGQVQANPMGVQPDAGQQNAFQANAGQAQSSIGMQQNAGPQVGAQTNGVHVEDNSVFNPDEYTVDVIYKPTGSKLYDVDFTTLDNDAKNAFIGESLSALKVSTLNIGNLVGLVQRKNKKLLQFDEMTKAFEYQKTDFENYKKRNKDLAEKAKEDGYCKVLTSMLPTIDNFERAIPMITDANVKSGVELILKQLQKTLTSLGVAEIDCMGKEFDPNFHNAILTGEAQSKEQEDTVIEVLQKGYTCGEKVLRYSQVRVAK